MGGQNRRQPIGQTCQARIDQGQKNSQYQYLQAGATREGHRAMSNSDIYFPIRMDEESSKSEREIHWSRLGLDDYPPTDARRVPCSICGAVVREPCIRLIDLEDGIVWWQQPYHRSQPHRSRQVDAEELCRSQRSYPRRSEVTDESFANDIRTASGGTIPASVREALWPARPVGEI